MQHRYKLIERLVFCMVRFRKGLGQTASVVDKELPPAQREALFVIGYTEHISLGGLSQQLAITPGAATQLVDALEHAKLVDRTPDPHDHRTIILTLSTAGQVYRDSVRGVKMRKLTTIMEVLSDEELETLTELLEKVAASVNDKKEKEK